MAFLSNMKDYLLSFVPFSTPSPPDDKPPPCKYRLDNTGSAILTLPDGRKLGYAEYGCPNGHPVLYMHGLPGARVEGARHDEIGNELGLRIITVDRPGVGWSSPHGKRRILDSVKDVEFLAEYLELERYAVWGISGGGPYALACAYALPASKLHTVSVVCGVGPPDIGMSGANWLHWLGFTWGYKYVPAWIGRLYWSWQTVGRLDLSDAERLRRSLNPGPGLHNHAHGADNQDAINNPDSMQLFLRAGREAFAQGHGAVWEDGRLMCNDWGFRVEDVRKDLTVQLWYGKKDSFIPLNHGLQIAARLGGRAQLRVEDEGHAGIAINWNRQILEAIADSVDKQVR